MTTLCAVDANTIFETSVAKAQCLEALAEAEKAGAEAEMARTEAEKAVMQAHARAEQTRAGANEMCFAPTTAPLLWQAERVPGDSDSSHQTETARRTSAANEAFSITSGSCLLETNGTCVTTPNFPSPYGPDEECSITMPEC